MDEEQRAAARGGTGGAQTLAAAGRSFLDTDRRDRRAEATGECAAGFAYPAATQVRVERQRG